MCNLHSKTNGLKSTHVKGSQKCDKIPENPQFGHPMNNTQKLNILTRLHAFSKKLVKFNREKAVTWNSQTLEASNAKQFTRIVYHADFWPPCEWWTKN